jgi:hypothetical protein
MSAVQKLAPRSAQLQAQKNMAIVISDAMNNIVLKKICSGEPSW